MRTQARISCMLLSAILALTLLGGCSSGGASVKLDPKNPVTIVVWHYYNGAIMNTFEAMIDDFNETVGRETGIIVEGSGHGNVSDLEQAVMAAANKEIGSQPMPNIFASYADTAYAAEKLGLLADLDAYFTADEQGEYLGSYIDEGRIGTDGQLRIFPIAKSTECLMVNETDWLPFAQECGFSYADLSTMEGLTRVAEAYYDWSGGKSFFGRDVMANLFIVSSKAFGTDIFAVQGGEATIQVNEEVMRKLWDNHYVPYISGCFSSYGRFRSDDAKVGDILAYVGSTASASYFPSEVTAGGESYPVTAKVLPAPLFEGADSVMVQQGAGMVVSKGTPQEEYASLVFLKWFTQTETNIRFASLSGYMPVKKEAINYDLIKSQAAATGITFDAITEETLRIAIDSSKNSLLYTNKAFSGGAAARAVLEDHLQSKAVKDREAVLGLMQGGMPREDAVAQFNTDEAFRAWMNDFTEQLEATTRE